MPVKQLPARPNLEQYKRQARDLVRDHGLGKPDAIARASQHHPRLQKISPSKLQKTALTRTDAQLVIAREHGFESWPKFAQHIDSLRIADAVASIADPVAAFFAAASVARDGHRAGTVDEAELILARYPDVATSSIYAAALLGDDRSVKKFLAQDRGLAKIKGGPCGWDALTYLCFSRYLRIDHHRSDAFVRAARVLLEAGAPANTGWYEVIDQPSDRTILESAIYGAAGVAQHAGVTRLLLEYGADPNDEETPYHAPESYDPSVMQVMLESGKLNATSLSWMLIRKADWHDEAGMRLLLEHGADPNLNTRWGSNALQHAVLRDNQLSTIGLLLDHGADAVRANPHHGRSAAMIAARRGRADILDLIEHRGVALNFQDVDLLIAACARNHLDTAHTVVERQPQLLTELVDQGGTLLTEFAGTGNAAGLRNLLDLGIHVDAPYLQGDGYWDIAKASTALHNAAWRGRHSAVKELITRGANVNAVDSKGRTPLTLAVKACVDSYWKRDRAPDSIEALLRAGANTNDVEIPCGYDEADALLRAYTGMDRI